MSVTPFQFFKGNRDFAEDLVDTPKRDVRLDAQRDFRDLLGSTHLSFLFGSGCSSALVDGVEVGVPTMAPMARALLGDGGAVGEWPRAEIDNLTSLGIDLSDDSYGRNLERLMEVLFSWRQALRGTTSQEWEESLRLLEESIARVSKHVRVSCIQGRFSDESPDQTVLHTYMAFYRKILQRDRALPRPWVFTTNYDVFNEQAMDRLGLPYINGFQGTVERRFNPSTYRYALAEQLDTTSNRWSAADGLMYLCKLHGSVSWQSVDDGVFPVVERPAELVSEGRDVLIYPTPAKQNASFASPYSDMFREFQTRIVREQSVLIAVGYSFGDEHVNNVIYQALTVPTFRLVLVIDPSSDVAKTLSALNDPRIWIVGGELEGRKAHYFSTFVESMLPLEMPDEAAAAIERLAQFVRQPLAKSGGAKSDD